jgi:hypothetical protein
VRTVALETGTPRSLLTLNVPIVLFGAAALLLEVILAGIGFLVLGALWAFGVG